jgi:DNA-binding NarL/FixJ family response regulator
MSIRVLIVDDQELVRTGFRLILESEPGLEIVDDVADGEHAVRVAKRERPDVILMDIRMPGMDGIEATRRICADGDAPRVLMLTTFDLDDYVYDALRAGASGFLLKDTPPDELVAAVRVLAAGDALLAPSVTRRLIEEFAKVPQRSDDARTLASLTDRESDVLKLLAKGLSNAEIAEELFVSETTVKTHVSRILTKLGVRDRVQAVVVAYESGLVVPGAEG